MSAALAYLDSLDMDRGVGERIRQRRTRMGISGRELASRAGVDRGQLADIEKGKSNPRATTVALIEGALSRLEHEMGMDDDAGLPLASHPEADLVEFTVEGNFGVRAVVRGPIRDMAALEAAVARLVREMKANPESDEG